MRITVLSENTASRPDLCAEHGLSLYVESGSHRLLADTGASELTWKNADLLGVDLTAVDTVFLSHGHYDHAGGLPAFLNRNRIAAVVLQRTAFGVFYHGEKYIGMDARLSESPRLRFADPSFEELDGELTVFSDIKGRTLFPRSNLELTERRNGESLPDRFSHEQCLVVREENFRVLFSGCAHNGIVNILERCKELLGCYPDAVFSGFHFRQNAPMTDFDRETIVRTAEYLSVLPTVFYTGHCTGDEAFALMKPILHERLRPISAGNTFTLPNERNFL